MCIFWLLNMLNGQDNSDGYLAYKSIIKQKIMPTYKWIKNVSYNQRILWILFKKIYIYLNKENDRIVVNKYCLSYFSLEIQL